MTVSLATPVRKREVTPRSPLVTACVVAVAQVPAAAYIWHLSRNGSHGLISYAALGVTCAALGAGVAAWGTWAAGSRMRNKLTRLSATLAIMVVAVAVLAATMGAWAYSVPNGRYDRAYGGVGQCLAKTDYASSRVDIKVDTSGVMTASPSQSGPQRPKLHFDHASKGDLSPADGQTRQVLEEHGC